LLQRVNLRHSDESQNPGFDTGYPAAAGYDLFNLRRNKGVVILVKARIQISRRGDLYGRPGRRKTCPYWMLNQVQHDMNRFIAAARQSPSF